MKNKAIQTNTTINPNEFKTNNLTLINEENETVRSFVRNNNTQVSLVYFSTHDFIGSKKYEIPLLSQVGAASDQSPLAPQVRVNTVSLVPLII